ncbi:Biopolymer transport protein ExbD/TolR [Anaeromyxobacter sp. K]|uniref:ExbD/TolR family protein n=1 Tax=Anaeromyxobacter sp. (strain K) TaxID=447217 RepID=UPI00015F931A|nr:biopolymer transporter ExbD [Anaeromyxobacter sp. K]ACG75352.1 Biopolymer transport protein ExbD/TolR [Anaeromyxobacter sp. K]
MALGGPSSGGDGGEDEVGGGIFADINITPLTDIFLVLLIIFMVTTTAIAEAGQEKGGFKVNLPKGGKGEASQIPQDLAVAVLADGRAVVGGKVLADDALTAAFAEAAGRNAELVVLVQADEGVPHGRVVQVMELARGAGLSRLAIATRADAASGSGGGR